MASMISTHSPDPPRPTCMVGKQAPLTPYSIPGDVRISDETPIYLSGSGTDVR
jgi:hypothetical protein